MVKFTLENLKVSPKFKLIQNGRKSSSLSGKKGTVRRVSQDGGEVHRNVTV